MSFASNTPTRSLRAGRGALLLAAVLAAVTLPASPAVAGTGDTRVYWPRCEVLMDGTYNCSRFGEAWRTNSPDVEVLGTKGSHQGMYVYYSPNNTRPSKDVEISASSYLWDQVGNWQRMRLTETFKALNSSGAALSVGWGVLDIGVPDPNTVTATQVTLSMTRQAPLAGDYIGRNAALTFSHDSSVRKVEHVTNGTIEYASTNSTYRLVLQIPLTDY